MKRILLILVGIVFISSAYAQTKYYIYFKDKGVESTNALSKKNAVYKVAESQLSERAIERRKKVMGNNFITFEDLPLNASYVNSIESLGIQIQNKLKWFNAVTAYLTDEQIDSIQKFNFVDKIVPVQVISYRNDEINSSSPQSKDNSPQALKKSAYSLEYGPSLTENALSDIPVVHDLGIKGTGVYIGILDDGFSYKTYNALKNLKVVKEYDYVHHLDQVSNQSGHGSSVFCLCAGYDPGHAIGPAYDAKFFLAETENDASETHVEEDNYAAALEDMEAAGVDITTSSLGYSIFDNGQTSYTYSDMNGTTTICAQAANTAFERGVTSFTAAGNEGDNSDWYYGTPLGGNSFGKIVTPGDALNIITVGAVDANNYVAGFSSRGPTSDGRIKPEVCAMGVNNYVALTNGVSYGYGEGTSYATPIAAGVGALLKSAYPFLTNTQIRKTFMECGDNVNSPDNNRGYGLVSAKRIISYPALKDTNSSYVLYKIFIDSSGVNSSSVRLNYKINGSNFQSVSMDYDGTLKYTFQLPQANAGDNIEFYFSYENQSNVMIHEPATGAYKFVYGNLLIDYDSSISDVEDGAIPTAFKLSQNYPNPFNPSTVINYSLPKSGMVSLKIYDLLGREVANLVSQVQSAGNYTVKFDASKLTSGIYFYRISSGSFMQTKKMMLLK